METLKKNPWLLSILTLVIGIVLGVVFYPTKKIEEKYQEQYSWKYERENELLRETNDNVMQQLTELQVTSREVIEKQEAELNQLRTKVTEYESNTHEDTTIIIRSDGSKEIRRIKDTHTKELTKVTEELNSKWEKKLEFTELIHQQKVQTLTEEYQEKLSLKEKEHQKVVESIKSSKVTTINQKRFGLEVGILTNLNYYSHATMDVAGPVFVGLQVQGSIMPVAPVAAGIGVGIRF